MSRSHVGMFETLPPNPNAFQAAKPLRVTDPRSALSGVELGGCIKMSPPGSFNYLSPCSHLRSGLIVPAQQNRDADPLIPETLRRMPATWQSESACHRRRKTIIGEP